MDEQIDFTKPWRMSDVVIHTLNSDGVGLHASKSLIAIFSPYFHAMFFGNYREKNAEQVELHEDFDVVHSALRILLQEDKNDIFGPPQELSAKLLGELYVFADKCDVRKIRDVCKQQLAQKTDKEALEVAVQLGLDDVKSKLVEKLDKATLQKFILSNSQERTFSVADVNVLLKKLTEATPFLTTATTVRLCTCKLSPGMSRFVDPLVHFCSSNSSCDKGIYHPPIQIHRFGYFY